MGAGADRLHRQHRGADPQGLRARPARLDRGARSRWRQMDRARCTGWSRRSATGRCSTCSSSCCWSAWCASAPSRGAARARAARLRRRRHRHHVRHLELRSAADLAGARPDELTPSIRRPAAARRCRRPVVVRTRRARFSLVWLVPIVALIVGAVDAGAHRSSSAGRRSTISFRNAEGLEASHTEVRFKEVVVGRVTKVALQPGPRARHRLGQPRQERAEPGRRGHAASGSCARASTPAGVSGLGTLFSGAYIGVDAGVSTRRDSASSASRCRRSCCAASRARSSSCAPTTSARSRSARRCCYRAHPRRPGRRLRARPGARRLSRADLHRRAVRRLVTPQSRFWNASGIDLQLERQRLHASTRSRSPRCWSAASPSQPRPAPSGAGRSPAHRFRCSTIAAPRSRRPTAPPLRVRMVFNQSLRGLAAGAPIDLLGVEIGTRAHRQPAYYDAKHHLPGRGPSPTSIRSGSARCASSSRAPKAHAGKPPTGCS